MLPLYMQDSAALTISRADAHPLVKHHALAVVLFGYTVIRNCFAPSHCNSVIARFRQFEAANQHIFAPHRDDKRIFEEWGACETLPNIIKGPDRQIKLAAVQQGRHIPQADRAQIQPYSRCC